MSYSEGSHDSPVDVNDRLQRVGSKYLATLAVVADGDNTFFAVDSKGRLIVVAHTKDPDASEVKTVRLTTGATSTTRSTELTPTSGKKVRVISLDLNTDNTAVAQFEVYFGTGTNITTNAGKEIAETRLDEQAAGMLPYFTKSWPDGGGPVGAADDVVSIRTSADIGTGGFGILTYREE